MRSPSGLGVMTPSWRPLVHPRVLRVSQNQFSRVLKACAGGDQFVCGPPKEKGGGGGWSTALVIPAASNHNGSFDLFISTLLPGRVHGQSPFLSFFPFYFSSSIHPATRMNTAPSRRKRRGPRVFVQSESLLVRPPRQAPRSCC